MAGKKEAENEHIHVNKSQNDNQTIFNNHENILQFSQQSIFELFVENQTINIFFVQKIYFFLALAELH